MRESPAGRFPPVAGMPPSRTERISVFLATGCAIGYLRPGPGTWASAAAVAIGLAAIVAGANAPVLLTCGLATYLLGYLVCPAAVRRFGCEDPSEVVIDEIAACWIALGLALSFLGGRVDPGMLAALVFAAFRIFDIVKPWPVGAVERLPNPTGIMADDLVAAVLAALVSAALLG